MSFEIVDVKSFYTHNIFEVAAIVITECKTVIVSIDHIPQCYVNLFLSSLDCFFENLTKRLSKREDIIITKERDKT